MNLHFRPNRKHRGSNVTINIFPEKEKETSKHVEQTSKVKVINKSNWFSSLLIWVITLIKRFFIWLWSHPKKFISAALAALAIWLYSHFSIKLPNLPFLPVASQPAKQKEESKKETPVEQSKTNVVTNTITQTNIVNKTNTVTQTNYVTETKYVTNFVLQPIIVTNTVYKEVPVTVTNVLVIKNNVTETNNNNKNSVINGPAFFFTEDFNTLLQNQQQNPIKGRTVN